MCFPFRLSILVLLGAFVLKGNVYAESFTWTADGDKVSWEDPQNWRPSDRFPGAGESDDEASIAGTSGGPSVVHLRRTLRLKRLVLGEGSGLHGGAIIVTEGATWTGGRIYTPVTVAPGARMVVEGAAEKYLVYLNTGPLSLISNAGELVINGPGQLNMQFGSRIENTGRVILRPGAKVVSSSCCLPPVSGIIGSGELALEPSFLAVSDENNQATLGNMTVETNGTIVVARGHRLILDGGVHEFGDRIQVGGEGVLSLRRSDATAGQMMLAAGATAEFADRSRLIGSVRLGGPGVYRLLGGGIQGNLHVSRGTRLFLSGEDRKYFEGSSDGRRRGILRNEGEIEWNGRSEMWLGGGARIVNAGTFRITEDVQLIATSCCTDPSRFANTGFLEKRGSTGESLFSGVFLDNAGRVEVARGRLKFEVPDVLVVQSSGETKLGREGAIAVGNVHVTGGKLSGSGRIEGNLINIAGEIAPGGTGAAGTLSVTGDYVQHYKGVLQLEIGGSSPSEIDLLDIGGRARLDGERSVAMLGGFRPVLQQEFEVLRYTRRSGTFARVTGLDLGPGLHLMARYEEAEMVGTGVLRLRAYNQALPSECRKPQQALQWDSSKGTVAQILSQSETAQRLFREIDGFYGVLRRSIGTGAKLGETGRHTDDPHNRQLVGFQFAWPHLNSVFHLSSVFVHEMGHGVEALRHGFTTAEAAPFLTREQYVTLKRSSEEIAFRRQNTMLAEIADTSPDFERCRADILMHDLRLERISADDTSGLRAQIAEDYPREALNTSWSQHSQISLAEREELRDVNQKVDDMLRTSEWRSLEGIWRFHP